jgi:hypothetical protein
VRDSMEGCLVTTDRRLAIGMWARVGIMVG